MVKLFKKILNIIKGTWWNITNQHQDLAAQRMQICKKCECKIIVAGQEVCNQCGCILESKTRVADEYCVLCKW